ncbi:HTH-type transcriptional regulatory protein GabR (plasmid) [Roseobacter fucihabitans]|uniref:HTH-type transcriptional regulatory protein GabR n=1 Tax=Roseobacter fucihabitans TaxID=1537242 RepID=A0ABZ2C1N8_9RHOB|nr:PLP-dependent aminotransferase family protein [Roseobacter litoralis]MBC6965962.1 HTH-type transcriptional regulatory protein GabR [Roseobacter litoralis]
MSNTIKKRQSNFDAALFRLVLDRTSSHSLQAQLINALRDLLVEEQQSSGIRLPSSRLLSQELSVSRTTVVGAYDQLISEGYLRTKTGGGTFAADQLPHLAPPRVTVTQRLKPPQEWRPFQSGIPDQSLFPHRHWARHIERAWATPDRELLAKPDPFGWYPLRQAISTHLSTWRKLECRPEQVLITSGAFEAFDLIFRGLQGPNSHAATEDPGWYTLRSVLGSVGTKTQPIRIDAEGFDAGKIAGSASVAVVTPSRHYPTGISMPMSRRSSLLAWAEEKNALIVEDDYDSEFRYQGHPLPSLAGLDGLKRSIYLGSFSKLLSPALRLGYLVLPEKLLSKTEEYICQFGTRASLIPQPALATFMESGEFAVHLRRMRRTYAKRQRHLKSELADSADLLDLTSDPSGMHLCATLLPKLRGHVTDETIANVAKGEGLQLRALSSHCVLPAPPQGLLLGYAAFNEEALSSAAMKLNQILTQLSQR